MIETSSGACGVHAMFLGVMNADDTSADGAIKRCDRTWKRFCCNGGQYLDYGKFGAAFHRSKMINDW